MLAASIAVSGKSNRRLEELFRRSGKTLPPNEAIARVARAIWPVKTDVELSVRTGTSDKACRNLLAGRTGMSLEAFVRLVSSEEGLEFLFAVLGDASPAWRKALEFHLDVAMERIALERQRQRIAKLEEFAGQELEEPAAQPRRLPLPRRR